MGSLPSSNFLRVSSYVLFVLLAPSAVGQVAAPESGTPSRIVGPIDESALTVLPGNTNPLAIAKFDRGAAPDTLPLERMLLVLKRSPEQETALRLLLDAQQDKSSPSYRKWLTPTDFGKKFGPSDQDLQAVTSWLATHGFQVTQVTKGRTAIEFRGTAAQVKEALHTQIHKYAVNGEEHWANASDPQIPTALTPVVAGVWSLHNFVKKSDLIRTKERFHLVKGPNGKPEATGSNGQHALGPIDYATIYKINPVYGAGIDGSGVTIAVVGRSNINLQDVFDFDNLFGLFGGTTTVVLNGPDPGNLGGGEEAEAILDTTWSGAIASGATVQLVVSATTNTTDGVDLSELYIVDNNLGDIMTESFGSCEAGMSATELSGIGSLAEQAAAQGITYTVSTGDTGAAGCDDLSETAATGPVSVSGLASTAFNVAVGGTIFNENGQDSKYWNATQGLNTALSYIPENVWNESCAAAQCGSSNANIAAGGGGASGPNRTNPGPSVPKPSWQSGVKNIPNDGARDLPDISLTAAGHDPYLLCFELSCSQLGELFGVSGTSASTPSFAGIMALVDQKMGGRVGLANYVLYRLAAAENLSQCNASNTSTLPAGSCVFNDVTVGNNAVPGEPGYGTSSAKYQSGAGFDLATGLGSVNVTNLINNWHTVTFSPSATTLTLNPQTNIPHGSAVAVTVGVTPASGTGSTPTGDVTLIAMTGNSPQGQSVTPLFPLTAGNAAGSTNALPGGSYSVKAHYAGNATYAFSESTPIAVTVTPEGSTTTASALTFDNSGNLIPITTTLPYGTFVYVRADVAGQSGVGVPSGQVNFLDNGSATVAGDPYTLNSQGNTASPNGVFTFVPGTHAITASYQGDVSFNASTSSAVAFTITQASSTSILAASPSTGVTPSMTVTFTLTLTTSSGGNGPSGTVTFFNGSSQIGTAGVVGTAGGFNSSGSFVGASGTATFATQLPVGTNSISAQYSGDTNYAASNGPAVTVTVSADFQIPSTLNAITVASPGGSGTTTLSISNVTGQSGYNGTINFTSASCTGLPFGATCSFNPATVTGTGSTTITVTTTAPHKAALEWRMSGGGWMLAGVFCLGIAGRRRRWSRALAVLMLTGLWALVGCGGGGGGGTTTPGTPIGSSNIVVTATTGAITHQTSFTLNVQ